MSESLPSLFLPRSTKREVSYEVEIDSSYPKDKPAFERQAYLIGVFAETGTHGGFGVPSSRPNESRLTLVSCDFTGGGRFSCRLDAKYVDLRAFQLLRNLLARLAIEGVDVTSIVVEEGGQRDRPSVGAPEPNDENEYDVYPEVSSAIGLMVEVEDTDFSKSRRCLVEMRDAVEASQVLGMADWIKPWYLLLEAGAFAMPVGAPDETDSISGSVTLFDEVTIEVSVNRFQASECAWNVLVNMLDAYSNNYFSVSKVTID